MSNRIIPLDVIAKRAAFRTCGGNGCGVQPAAGMASAESPAANDLPPSVWERIKEHPCYSEEAHHFFARIHLAVAPGCNIQCHYCNRKYDCANESRPGVVSKVLSPDEAVAKVLAVAARIPQLSVVGIAGPGDALLNADRTFATFAGIAEKLPDVKLCLSTNGLALPDHVERIKALKIDHVTITINAVDPDIGSRIYPWIFHEGRRWTGLEAATILLERQLMGLSMLVAADVLVKVNSVLIPGINDHHLAAVNAAIKKRGAFLHNIMPLISDPAHGTHFGLTGQRGPTPLELKAVQDTIGGGARLMKHCRQCRADAIGLLGQDHGQEAFAPAAAEAVAAAAEKRNEYRRIVEKERADRLRAASGAIDTLKAVASVEPARLVAVCTKGGGRVNQHFGHASEFQIFEVDHTGVRLVGHRRAGRYCQGGDGEDDVLDAVIAALDGVSAILCARIGRCPAERLKTAGIETIEDYAFQYIEPAVAAYFRGTATGASRTATSA
ncbi:MAG: nitrogenase cofactor biosynthesis protein NifB [Hyphomicrobium sp.]